MSKLVDFLSQVDRETDPAALSMTAVLEAARRSGLDLSELAVIESRDASKISGLITARDATILDRTHTMVQAPDEEEEEEEEEEEKT